MPLSVIVDAWEEGKESINECGNILLNKVMSTSDVQQLQDQYASCLESDIHDGDDDGGDNVNEDKKYSNVNTKINTLIDAGILKVHVDLSCFSAQVVFCSPFVCLIR